MTERELRNETLTPKFREEIKRVHGEVCANCGSTENIHYHHVVPLKLGGTNRIENIVPLCNKCHMAAHYGRHAQEYGNWNRTGRKRKVLPDGYEDILRRYIFGEIGKAECQRLLGIGGNGKYSNHALNTNREYRQYLKDNGIVRHKNSIDMLNDRRNHNVKSDHIVARIEYENGEVYCRRYDGSTFSEKSAV